MKAKQIYDELKKHDPEWLRKFLELAKLYREATPEQQMKVIDMLRKSRG